MISIDKLILYSEVLDLLKTVWVSPDIFRSNTSILTNIIMTSFPVGQIYACSKYRYSYISPLNIQYPVTFKVNPPQ